jgi:hypothetical protein
MFLDVFILWQKYIQLRLMIFINFHVKKLQFYHKFSHNVIMTLEEVKTDKILLAGFHLKLKCYTNTPAFQCQNRNKNEK